MSTFRETYGGRALGGGTPNGHTSLQADNKAYAVIADGSYEDGQALEISSTGPGRARLLVNAAGTGTTQDPVVRFRMTETGMAPGVIINSGADDEYLLEAFGTALTIWEKTGGGSYATRSSNSSALGASLAADTWYYMRFRRSGNVLYGRIWLASAIEPSGWQVTYTDSGSPRSAGGAGVSVTTPSGSGDLIVDMISIGTDEDCGCILADEDLPLVGPAITSAEDGSVRVSNPLGTVHAVIAIFGALADIRACESHNIDREFYVTGRIGTVFRIDRFGRNRESLLSVSDAYGLAVDSENDQIYVTSRAAGIIYKFPSHAPALTVWKNLGASSVAGYISVDEENARVIWADHTGVYICDPDGSNVVDYDTLSEELSAVTDGTNVYAADYTSPGGVYSKPFASPGDSWTSRDTSSLMQVLAFDGDKTALFGVDNVGGEVVKWSSLPPGPGNRTTFVLLEDVRYVSYFNFANFAWPSDALVISHYALESDASDTVADNDLTAVNTPVHVPAVIGNGMSVDAVTQNFYHRLNVDAGAFQVGTDSISFGAWVTVNELPAVGGVAPIFYMGGVGSTATGWHLGIASNGTLYQFLARLSDGVTLFNAQGAFKYAVGERVRVDVTINRTRDLDLYELAVRVSGSDIKNAATTDIQSTYDFRLAGTHQRYFDGVIDEATLWRRSRSAWEIRHIENAGAGRPFVDLQTTGFPRIEGLRASVTVIQNATDLSTAAPAGIALGELLCLVTALDAGTGTINAPTYAGGVNDGLSAGFSTGPSDSTSSPSYVLHTKVAGSDDVDQAANGDGYNLSWSTIQGAVQALLRISGHNGVDAISSVLSISGTTTPLSPGVTTTVDGCLILGVLMVDDSNGGNLDVVGPEYSALVLREYHAVPGSGGGVILSIAARHQPTAGQTGAMRWRIGSGRNVTAYTIAIAPAETGVDVSLAIVDGPEQIEATAAVVVDAVLAITDGPEEIAAEVDVVPDAVDAALAITDGPDELAAQAAVVVGAALGIVDGPEQIEATAAVVVDAVLAITDGPEQVAANVTVVTDAVDVLLAIVDGPEQIEATAAVIVDAALAITDGPDELAAQAAVVVGVALAIVDGPEQIAVVLDVVAEAVTVSLAITDGLEQLTALVLTTSPVTSIEVSARPDVGIVMAARPEMTIRMSARPLTD